MKVNVWIRVWFVLLLVLGGCASSQAPSHGMQVYGALGATVGYSQ